MTDRICRHCGGPIPAHRTERSPYCTNTCMRAAKRKRAKQNQQQFRCPACGQTGMPMNTAAGAVCADCAPSRSCGKLVYRSREAAEWAVRALGVRRDNGDEWFGQQRAYYCPLCEWHLTTKPLRKRSA